MDTDLIGLVGTLGAAFLVISGMWGVFAKAGRPGWYALIPVFNLITLCRVSGVSGWLALLLMVPLLNIITMIYLSDKLAKAFGKGIGYTLGLAFLGMAFLPLLGFGEAKYQGPPAQA